MTHAQIRNLAAIGENNQIEFKQKLNEPDNILKEMVAFANSKGGNLLVGVADNGTITGVKDPFEITSVLQKGINDQIFPRIRYMEEIIPISLKRSVVNYKIYTGKRKPYYLNPQNSRKGTAYVRYEDQSIKASWELIRILKEPDRKKGFTIQLTDLHHQVIRLFKESERVTVHCVIEELNIERRLAGSILTSLVLANILGIGPAEKGDVYYDKENSLRKSILLG